METSAATRSVQDSPETIRRQLLYLRKGPGFSTQRLRTLPELTRLLGAPDEPPEHLVERFESAIRSLRDEDAELLLSIYGLDERTSSVTTLGDRRTSIGQQLGIKRDAVADRESGAIERLLTQLITGWYPKSPLPISIPESHNGIVNYSVNCRVVLQDGHLVELLHHNRYFAAFDGTEYIQIDTTTNEPIQVLDGYRLDETPMRAGRRLRFYPSEPLRRGETYDLRYRIAPALDESDPHLIEGNYLAFHEPTRRAKFEAEFRGRQPTWVWWFTGLTHLEMPGEPYRERLRAPDESGRLEEAFTDLYGGLWTGLAWEW